MLALVLSGGANRGALQVGALEVLWEHNIVPDFIVGSSIGAINGGFVAISPTLERVYELAHVWRTVKREDIYPGRNPRVIWNLLRRTPSLFSNEAWQGFLASRLPVETFGELPVPFYTISADLDSDAIKVFGDTPSDKLIDALMASTALPPYHAPWEIDGRRYVDGAIVANLPLRQAVARGATEIIALHLPYQPDNPENIQNAINITYRASDIMTKLQVERDLEIVRAQGVHVRKIDLKTNDYFSFTEFGRMDELIASGRATMLEAMRLGPLRRQRFWQLFMAKMQA